MSHETAIKDDGTLATVNSGATLNSVEKERIRIKALREGRKIELYPELPPISQENKLKAMLGHKLEKGALHPVFWREDYCGFCGHQHGNPALLDAYNSCEKCQNTLRATSHLRERFSGVIKGAPLEVLFATCKPSLRSSHVSLLYTLRE